MSERAIPKVKVNDPQFIYMMLVLPSLFGLTLLGEGLHKSLHDDFATGLVSIVFGVSFIGVVVFAFLFFDNFFSQVV